MNRTKRNKSYREYLAERAEDPIFQKIYENRKALALGMQITELRKSHGLTQKELAVRAGLRPQNVARLENPNYVGHTIGSLIRIAEALGNKLKVQLY